MGEELKRVVAYKLLSADRDTVIDGLMEMVFANRLTAPIPG